MYYSYRHVHVLSYGVLLGTLLGLAGTVEARPVAPWCAAPKQGFVVLVHDTRKFPQIEKVLPSGSTAIACRWFPFRPEGRSATPLSIRVGDFDREANANAWANRIRTEVFKNTKSTLVEVIRPAAQP